MDKAQLHRLPLHSNIRKVWAIQVKTSEIFMNTLQTTHRQKHLV